MRVALATCAELPALDADDRLLADALAARGVETAPAVWDDADVAWAGFDLVVVRSTWDYTLRRERFLAWADGLGPRLLNPPAVLRWNTDKRYLGELEAAGLPVVPTTFVAPGEAFAPPERPVVVKPTVSAGALDTVRHDAGGDEAAAHVARLHAQGRTAMVQPYLEQVDEAGETALLYVEGTASHAARKGALLRDGAQADRSGLFVVEDIAPRTPSAAERAVGDAVVAWLGARFGPLLYARVDLLPGPGGPTLLELEVTEPSLFLGTDEGAAERLAGAVVDRLGR